VISAYFEPVVQPIIEFARNHAAWTPVLVGVLAFCESLVIISFFVPATAILLGIGAVMGGADIPFLPVWLAAVVGAVLGDWISYWVGKHYKEAILNLKPLKNHQDSVQKAEKLFENYGVFAVFFGRFLGPLRATVPLIAGSLNMPQLHFQVANIASALVWAFAILGVGNGLTKHLGVW
jgi:membrane protein DedA with SNARE-associated domain